MFFELLAEEAADDDRPLDRKRDEHQVESDRREAVASEERDEEAEADDYKRVRVVEH